MKILYTPVGDTDPIRGYRDGGMLHIVRHYNPDKVVMFMTEDMVNKENFDQRYTQALLSVKNDLLIDYIKTDLTDPHHIDSLNELVSNFINLHKLAQPDDLFLLNLSSGTPQMKMIMAFLGREYNQTLAIQVDSPMKGSNRENPAFLGKKEKDLTIAELIASNQDNDADAPNRCSEPAMNYIRKVIGRNEILSLINAYEYTAALEVLRKYKKFFPATTATLLQHAAARIILNSQKAQESAQKISGEIHNPVLELYDKATEQLMVLELHARKQDGYSFVMKLTPVITYAVQTKMEELGFDFAKIFILNYKKIPLLSFELLAENYPDAYYHLQKTNADKLNEAPLSLGIMLTILEAYPEHAGLLAKLRPFRILERNLRNTYAHQLEGAPKSSRRTNSHKPASCKFIDASNNIKYDLALSELKEIMNFQKENVYDTLNQIITNTLKLGNCDETKQTVETPADKPKFDEPEEKDDKFDETEKKDDNALAIGIEGELINIHEIINPSGKKRYFGIFQAPNHAPQEVKINRSSHKRLLNSEPPYKAKIANVRKKSIFVEIIP